MAGGGGAGGRPGGASDRPHLLRFPPFPGNQL